MNSSAPIERYVCTPSQVYGHDHINCNIRYGGPKAPWRIMRNIGLPVPSHASRRSFVYKHTRRVWLKPRKIRCFGSGSSCWSAWRPMSPVFWRFGSSAAGRHLRPRPLFFPLCAKSSRPVAVLSAEKRFRDRLGLMLPPPTLAPALSLVLSLAASGGHRARWMAGRYPSMLLLSEIPRDRLKRERDLL